MSIGGKRTLADDRGYSKVGAVRSPAVSVVVASYNRSELLTRCLCSLENQTWRDFEVLVVDDGSDDESVGNAARSASGLSVRVIVLPRPHHGFSRGCSAGMAEARGRYVATLNNDTEADPRWLEELVRAMESSPDIGMGASKILFLAERNRIDKAGHLIYLDGLNHGRGSGELDLGQFDREEEVLFPDGAAAIYRREMLEVTGLYDERFVGYGDDADIGLRGRLAGWRCAYVPTAVVYHVHSATWGKYSLEKAFLIERNRVWVAIKTFPLALLLLSPIFTLVRVAFHCYGAIFGVGSSGEFSRQCSGPRLALTMLKAWGSAIRGAPEMWRSRRGIRRFKRLSDRRMMALLWRHRISARALTLRA